MQSIEKLLTAKITPPRIGVETIWRQRLLGKFEGYKYKKITVVSAPTGYGKTVLISQFSTQVDNSVVWYQLDEFDNDLTMFIRYFITGISRKISHFGLQTLDFIERHDDVAKQIRSIVVLLANELEARAKEGIIFIFDDYHLINERLIHKFVEALIAYLPEKVHLVISSRYKLPLNLVRLKAHGLVNEITSDCLKFSRDEIRMFFNFHKPIALSEDIIEKARLETDGWAVALSLLKISFQRMKEEKRNISLIQWKNREEVYHYLAEEVFYQLPEVLQIFLMNTSILDVMTPDICDELIEANNSKEILRDLTKRNIFFMKLEGEDDAYRYHHLFRDFLQERLGDKKKMLLEKAAQYYLDKGNFEQGVEYYLAAGVYKKAALVLEKIGMKMLKSGEWQTVNRWIKKITKEFIKKSPWFMLFKGVIYSYKGMWNEALMQMDRALEIFLAHENQEGIFNAQFQKSSILRRAGLLNESLELLNKILPMASESPILDWYDVILEKVNILLWNGCLNEAVETLKQGIEFAQQDEEHRIIACFMEHLGATYYATGDYYKAVEFYQASKERYLHVCNNLSEIEEERYSQRTTLARIYRDWGELEKALELIREEIDTKERLGLIDDLPRAYHQLALFYNDLGEKQNATRYFQHADEMYQKLDRKDFQWTWHLVLYGKILIDNGNLKKGKTLIEKAIEQAKGNSDFNLAVCEYIGACGYIVCGEMCETITLLEHALEVGKNVGAKNLICQCYWVLSNIYLNMRNKERAEEYAANCFALAREGNYMQIFLSYQASSFPVIKLGIEMGIEKEFLEKVVLRLGSRSEEILLELIESAQPDIKSRAKQLLLKVRGKEMLPEHDVFLDALNKKIQNNVLVKVYCFGNFEVLGKYGSKPIQWKTTKAKEVFAYLMRHEKGTISKEKILEDIWPDMNPEQTSKWLHTYIYQIRNVLKNLGIEKGVRYENKGYRLVNKGIISDVERFEDMIKESKKKDIDNKVRCLEEAIRLYGGEYLQGCYNQWVIDERQRLEGIYLLALEKLATTYIETKEYNRAADYLHIILKTDPLLEKANEMLMITYQKMGDRIAAIQQYEAYHQTLKGELGIEPKIEMKDLYNRLMEEN